MARLTGRIWIKVNGSMLRSNEGAQIDLGGAVRETVVGSHTVHGFHEKIKPGRVECQVAVAQGDSPESLRDISGATLTCELDTGQTYIIRDAHVLEPPVIQEGGGQVSLVFEGQPAERA